MKIVKNISGRTFQARALCAAASWSAAVLCRIGRASFTVEKRQRTAALQDLAEFSSGQANSCNRISETAPALIYFPALLTAVLFFTTPVFAQRAFTVSVAPTNGNATAVSWRAQSATPTGDLFIIPQFQVERSSDLKNWTPISGQLAATLNQRLTFADPQGGVGFYRVNSIINQEYAQLSNAKLDGGQLQFADFFGAELFAASLQSAVLTNASFAAADIRNANFSNANLTNAIFFAANALSAKFDSSFMNGVDASFADFEAASLFDVNLTGANFSSAVLTGADFRFATFKQMTLDANTVMDAQPKLVWSVVNSNAVNAVLTNKDFSFARLNGVSFNGAKLNNSVFTESFLNNADVRGANLTNATLIFVTWVGAQMNASTVIEARSRLTWQIINQNFGVGRDLRNTNLVQMDLNGANFFGANLSNAVLSASLFESANFGTANLAKANCINCDFFQAMLTNAVLTNANFSGAIFSNASLRNANTNGAIFTGATFFNTIMPNGSIRNF